MNDLVRPTSDLQTAGNPVVARSGRGTRRKRHVRSWSVDRELHETAVEDSLEGLH